MTFNKLSSMTVRFFGELRYRYEFVDQNGFSEDAHASTLRVNLGYKTGVYYDFQALVEGQLVEGLGVDDFNSLTNGQTLYPTVADADNTEVNRAWLSWSGLPDTTVKVGRQAVNLDNQRFIGTVGWRQNDQTFDAAAITNSSIPGTNLLYGYVRNVNRIFGDDHNLGDLKTKTHLINASYKLTDWMSVTGYGYLLDINRAAALSSKTYGLRLNGSVPMSDDWSFFYTGEAATQQDYGNNTADYDEEYYHFTPGIKGYGLSLQIGYEELGGNGTNSFKTPLATLHKFNGWADKFLSTPATGLQDAYAKVTYKVSGAGNALDGFKFTGVYHDFEGDSNGDYGSEIDLAIGKTFKLDDTGQPFKNISLLLKYSDYQADDTAYTDTQKVWFQIGTKF